MRTQECVLPFLPIAEASTDLPCDLDTLQQGPNNNVPHQWNFDNALPLMGLSDSGPSAPSFSSPIAEAIFDIEPRLYWDPDGLYSIQSDHQAHGQCADYFVQNIGTNFPNLQNSYVPAEQPDQTNSTESPTKRQGTTKQPKAVKPRVKCTFSGCRKTFPRKYELNRHTKSVHERTFAVFCPVYGCPRTEKALPREDKFLEHMKKHQNPLGLLCPVPDCRVGPFSLTELKVHASTHQIEDLKKATLVINQYLHWKASSLQNGLVQVVDVHECPLSSTGCKFQASRSLTFHNTRSLMANHITEHELRERSIGYYEIILCLDFWVNYGLASCLICGETFMDPSSLIRHINQHSEAQWPLHATHLYEQLSPFMDGKTGAIIWREDEKREFTLLCEFLRNWKAENDLKLLGESDKPSTPTLLENQN
ncbi:hypothetical protein B0J14DRAFT_662195 [Halenospora varia]|nr:hypothetical protein B0J14DRAFT_662195 [Halenospora varia]